MSESPPVLRVFLCFFSSLGALVLFGLPKVRGSCCCLVGLTIFDFVGIEGGGRRDIVVVELSVVAVPLPGETPAL